MNLKNSVKIAVMAVLLAVMCVSAHAAGNIDATNKYAWSENAGWINFKPTGGGVTVYADHLEGYAWNENIGWIRLGTHTAGGTHTYTNNSQTTYGVNNNGSGTLAGYGWSENVGWIKFDPAGGGVTIDGSGNFSGYAWGENIGWINFANTTPAYKVVTTWTPTVPTYLLTVSIDPAGTGTGTVGGGGNYAAGVTVTPVATPAGGSTVVWTPSSCAAGFAMPANAYTCTATFNLSGTPAAGVSMVSVTNVKATTALAAGTASGTGITERGFFWWNDEQYWGDNASGLIPAGYGAGDFSLTLTGLPIKTQLYVSAYVKIGGQVITSGPGNFISITTTDPVIPTVITKSDFTVNGNELLAKGEVTDIGNTPVSSYGFVYAHHTAPTVENGSMDFSDRIEKGKAFEGTIKNLAAGKYYFRAYARNGYGTAYGEEFSFTIGVVPGDLNGDGNVDLGDVIIALKILDGIPVADVNLKADVNGDCKIGLEEAIFVLQKVGMLR